MRRRLRRALVSALALGAAAVHAQTEGMLQIEGDLQRFVLRQHALGRVPWLDTGALPLATATALAALDSLAAGEATLSPTDAALVAGWRGTAARGMLTRRVDGLVYRDGRSFARVAGPDYAVEAAPVLELSGGPTWAERAAGAPVPSRGWTFSRGLRAAGHVGRFFVETRIAENQSVRPLEERQPSSAPRLANVPLTAGFAFDYLTSVGVVGYRGPRFEARAGRDRARLGFARGSLILSNYAAEYDHVQLRWTLGPLAAQSLYARFLEPKVGGDGLTEGRYGAFHRIALQAGRGVELEVFEGVVASGRDADGQRRGFEPAYLVPFQLYRAVERDLGSPDNVMLGAGAAWRPVAGVRLYGQGLLDELVAARFFEDAWTNKWGYVAGLQLADPGLPGVGRLRDTDVRLEYARIRPYVYAHRDASTAAVHFRDGLGHPAGPNVSDVSLRLAHRPSAHWEVSADLAHTIRGRNADSLNYGSDPYLSYDERVPDPTPTLQGVRQRLVLADVRVAAVLLPDAVAGAALSYRRISDAVTGRAHALTPSVFVRWSLAEFGPRY